MIRTYVSNIYLNIRAITQEWLFWIDTPSGVFFFVKNSFWTSANNLNKSFPISSNISDLNLWPKFYWLFVSQLSSPKMSKVVKCGAALLYINLTRLIWYNDYFKYINIYLYDTYKYENNFEQLYFSWPGILVSDFIEQNLMKPC